MSLSVPTRWRRSMTGITGRVFLSAVSIVSVVIAATFVISSASMRSTGVAAARRSLEQSADLVAQFLAGRSRSLSGGARVFVQGPYFRTLVAEGRRDDILDQAFEASEQLGADWVFITNARGILLAKSDEPAASDVAMGAIPLVAGALRGLTTSGFGVSRDSLLFQSVGVPILTPGGAPIGVLVATRIVDSLLVHDVKSTTSSDLVFFARTSNGARNVAVSTLGRNSDVAVALARMPDRGEAEGTPAPELMIGGVPYLAQGTSLTTAGGDAVGGFVVLRSRDAALTGLVGLRRSLTYAGVLGLLLSWLASVVAARQLTAPLRRLTATVDHVADGTSRHVPEGTLAPAGGAREVQELGTALAGLVADLRDKEALTGLSPIRPARVDLPEITATPPQRRSVLRAQSRAPEAAPRHVIRSALTLDVGAMLANRYRIDAVVGAGGLGMVYRAFDRVVGENVAVKVLRPEVLAREEDARDRFLEELRVARRISHRNIVRVHDVGDADGVTFLTMEFVEGTSLATVIETRGALQPAAVISIARQLMRALSVMHAEGVVHGDLKPANLLLSGSGVLKVSDFGVARVVRRTIRAESATGEGLMTAATVGQLVGAVVGTPEYMAPEQLIGAPATIRTDLYAAGIVLHEALTGTTPFSAETRVTFLAHKLGSDSGATTARQDTPLSTHATPLERIVARMTAPAPEQRPESAVELYDAFVQLDRS